MQRSKLQLWCEGIIEAGWLAALIVAPLFFNVYSSRVFEPDKISLIRSIALVMLLAYLIKLADSGRAWLVGDGVEDDESTQATVPEEADPPWYNRSGARWARLPFVLPVGLLILAYTVSTLLSVAPYVSWWGSYQRLQGTYTFFSYIVIAVLTAAHLRRPEQLRRLQHTVIITSLPIAIYGVVQHFDIDPLPWGGDVVTRVSANAGNPIFLAAHLIMAFFLTLERIFSSFAYLLQVSSNEASASSDARDGATAANPQDMPSALVGGSYLFVLIVQALAIFWTQSRGPWIGLAAGVYMFVLLLITGLRPRNYRAWTASWVGLGVSGAVLLVLINTTPLGAPLQDVPYAGRLTTMLETDTGTGRVRVLIWEGVADMVSPHEPITYPDGEPDWANPIRPLVGYGPEAMWVAYNSFYPPELAQVEARNASPDRAHNETWDSLAITGAFGFVAYVLLFLALFYWALRWLGLITNRRDFYLFIGLWLGLGAVMSGLFYIYDDSWRFFGVALPIGFILGLITYVTLAVFLHPEAEIDEQNRRRHLLIVAILATITAHYVEIHFGIAIAATRTYFWVLSALLLTLGMGWLQPEPFANLSGVSRIGSTHNGNKRRRRGRGRHSSGEGWLSSLPATVMPDLMVMLTLAFLYTTNFEGLENPFEILFRSLTIRMAGSPGAQTPVQSPGILFLLLFTWLIAVVVGLSVAALQRDEESDAGWWLKGFVLYSGVLWVGWLFYGLVHAGRLIPGAAGTDLTSQLNHIAGHFTLYTWIVVIWCVVSGLPFVWQFVTGTGDRRARRAVMGRPLLSMVGGLLLAVVIFAIISSVNVALVRADVLYKQGQQFDSSGNWVSSAELYRRALAARPTEDHYMLFLGRSLLEQAKQAPAGGATNLPQELSMNDVFGLNAQDISQLGRDDLLRAAETVLLKAQDVNPLNTDHTANLARLYRSWADLSSDPELRTERLEQSLEYYNTATTLSPNAAHLWNEKGGTLMLMGQVEEAEEAYRYSLSLDEQFEQTYLLLAELYDQQGEDEQMIEVLETGLENIPNSSQIRNYLSVVQARTGNLDDALQTNLDIIERNPNDANAARNLAILYRDLEQYDNALEWTENALSIAQQQNLEQLQMDMYRLQIELYSQRGDTEQVIATHEQMANVSPEDPTVLANLASIYLQNGRVEDAVPVLEQLTALAPEDYRYPFQLAQLYQQMGETDAARRSAEQALSLAPDGEQETVQQFLTSLGG